MTQSNERSSLAFRFFFLDTKVLHEEFNHWWFVVGNEMRCKKAENKHHFYPVRIPHGRKRRQGYTPPRWAVDGSKAASLLSQMFAKGGRKVVAVFQRETPVIATAMLPNVSLISSDANLIELQLRQICCSAYSSLK